MSINFVLASMLAQAICGVMKRRLLSLMRRNGLFGFIGSSVSTSSPAAAIVCCSMAFAKSCSFTMAPRPTLMKIAWGFIFANAVLAEDGDPINEVTLTGPICKDPIFRRTPLGREICDVMLAVPRAFKRADYLPCILWGRTAQDISRCQVRDVICIQGRLQSRVYTKLTENGPVERTAYEISALTAEIVEDCL